MKLLFHASSKQSGSDKPLSELVRVVVSPVAEDLQEDILLQFLRQQPELLVFTIQDVRGEWVLKRRK